MSIVDWDATICGRTHALTSYTTGIILGNCRWHSMIVSYTRNKQNLIILEDECCTSVFSFFLPINLVTRIWSSSYTREIQFFMDLFFERQYIPNQNNHQIQTKASTTLTRCLKSSGSNRKLQNKQMKRAAAIENSSYHWDSTYKN